MSAEGVAEALVEAIEPDKYDFIVANFANPDMVGHTGVWEPRLPRSRPSMSVWRGSSRRSSARCS